MSDTTPSWGPILRAGVPHTWSELLGEATLDAIEEIGTSLSARVAGERIAPEPHHVFRALQVAPHQVSVLLVGQDPYPTDGHAMGWSFSVPCGVRPLPPSARNIRTELSADVGIDLPAHFELGHWVKQGVLLLNRHLTTAVGQPGAHHQQGWERVTNRIVEVVATHNDSFVSIIWGKQAAGVLPLLRGTPVIESAHPSPLSAHRGFFGSKPFSRANQFLEKLGRTPIDWRLEEA